jgi:hypothetical protein
VVSRQEALDAVMRLLADGGWLPVAAPQAQR